MFDAIVIIAVIVSLLGVHQHIRMSVIERTREIDVVRARGASGTLIGASWVQGLDKVLPGIGFHFPGPVALAVAGAAVVLGVTAAIVARAAPPGSR